MSDEYFYAKKGAVSIECDEDEIVVIRRGSKHYVGHLMICMVLVFIAVALTVGGLMISQPDEIVIVGLITFGMDVVAFGILAAVLNIREKVSLTKGCSTLEKCRVKSPNR